MVFWKFSPFLVREQMTITVWYVFPPVETYRLLHVNPPTPLVGAGRAIGALAFKLCISAKTSYSYGSARGGLPFQPSAATFCRIFGWILVAFWLPCHGGWRFGGELVFGMAFGISDTPRGPWGRAFWRYSLGWFLAMPELCPPNWAHISCGFQMHVAVSQLTTSPQALHFFEPSYIHLPSDKFPWITPNETYASKILRCGRLSTRSVRYMPMIQRMNHLFKKDRNHTWRMQELQDHNFIDQRGLPATGNSQQYFAQNLRATAENWLPNPRKQKTHPAHIKSRMTRSKFAGHACSSETKSLKNKTNLLVRTMQNNMSRPMIPQANTIQDFQHEFAWLELNGRKQHARRSLEGNKAVCGVQGGKSRGSTSSNVNRNLNILRKSKRHWVCAGNVRCVFETERECII